MPRPPQPERDAEIVRLRREGETLKAIGKRFGLTRARICQIAKDVGLGGTHDKPMRWPISQLSEAERADYRLLIYKKRFTTNEALKAIGRTDLINKGSK